MHSEVPVLQIWQLCEDLFMLIVFMIIGCEIQRTVWHRQIVDNLALSRVYREEAVYITPHKGIIW